MTRPKICGFAMDIYAQSELTKPGRKLHQRFLAFGDMTGKTFEEIAAFVGSPYSIEEMAADHQTVVFWQATGCHMVVQFGPDGKFVKLIGQVANYAVPPAGRGMLTVCSKVRAWLQVYVCLGIRAWLHFRLFNGVYKKRYR